MPTWTNMYQPHHSQQNHAVYAKDGLNDHHRPGTGCDYNHYMDQDFDNQGGDHSPWHPDQLLYNNQWKDASLVASTPQSPGWDPGEGSESLVLTRQQIREHNKEVGWQQWVTLKGIVYHTTGFRDHFISYNKKKAAEKQVLDQHGTSSETPYENNLNADDTRVLVGGQCGALKENGLNAGEKQALDQYGTPLGIPHDNNSNAVKQALDQSGALHVDSSNTCEKQALNHCGPLHGINSEAVKRQSENQCDESLENKSILTANADTLRQACDRLLRENAAEFNLKDIAAAVDSSNCTNVNTNMSDTDDEDDDSDESEEEEDFLWQYDVIGALRKSGLSMSEIEQEIAPFKIGTLNSLTVPLWKYWESIRADVIAVHDDITIRPSEEVSDYEREYLSLLQQWLRKYRYMDPEEKHPGGDGNARSFFLTRDPDTLRGWIRTLPPVDTELPESGAWESHEASLLSPLPDTHNVFAASLRSHHSDHKLLSHEIHGDVAWRELPSDVVMDDVMTEDQRVVHEAREKRGDSFRDPERMRKRRMRLGAYFTKKYHFSPEKMVHFLQWADVMDRNEQDLVDLCPSDDNDVAHESETDL
ncbi:uncharacterized protein [Littorina saxatilis]|uniref:Uncharacterized protein n=1 Tax=Littorina saxatilis TaxID=31220 RepID=A0AAN9BDX8_9CAEN